MLIKLGEQSRKQSEKLGPKIYLVKTKIMNLQQTYIQTIINKSEVGNEQEYIYRVAQKAK